MTETQLASVGSSPTGRREMLQENLQTLQNVRSVTLDSYAAMILGDHLEKHYINAGIDTPIKAWLVSRSLALVVIPGTLNLGDDTVLEMRAALGLTPYHSEEIALHVTAQLHMMGPQLKTDLHDVEAFVSRVNSVTVMFRIKPAKDWS